MDGSGGLRSSGAGAGAFLCFFVFLVFLCLLGAGAGTLADGATTGAKGSVSGEGVGVESVSGERAGGEISGVGEASGVREGEDVTGTEEDGSGASMEKGEAAGVFAGASMEEGEDAGVFAGASPEDLGAPMEGDDAGVLAGAAVGVDLDDGEAGEMVGAVNIGF